MPASSPPITTTIAAATAQRKAWICDIWGVMHNGVAAFEAACEACCKFRQGGGFILLLTNAPRPSTSVAAQLETLGVPNDAYDLILTSGDMTRTLIERALPSPLFHLGPPRDKPLFSSFDVDFVGASQAEVVVCTGLFHDDRETPADYEAVLSTFKSRDVPMICANPDIKVERGDTVVYCAGALAQRYAELGGPVTFAGKPHLPVYDRAIEMINEATGTELAKADILAIGDGVHTDIAGAANAGIDAVFIASRIHVTDGLTDATISQLFAHSARPPIAAMQQLAW